MPRKKLEKTTESNDLTPQTDTKSAGTAANKRGSASRKTTPDTSKASEPKTASPKESSSKKPAKAKSAPVVEPEAAELTTTAPAKREEKVVTPKAKTPASRAKAAPKKVSPAAKPPREASPEVVEPEVAEVVSEPSPAPRDSQPTKIPLFGRKPKAPLPEPTAAAIVEPVAEPSVKAPSEAPTEAQPPTPTHEPKDRKRSRSRKKPVAEPAAVEIQPNEPEVESAEGFDFASLDLPVPQWRPRQNAGAPAAAREAASETSTTEEEGEEATGDRRRRKRRRRVRPSDEVSEELGEAAPVSEESGAEEPEETSAGDVAPSTKISVRKSAPAEAPEFRRDRPPVKPPEKAAIAIPEDAPQIVMRNGVPTLVREHRVYPPIMFFGSPSDERRTETVMEEVRMAAEAGVHLHSYLIDFEVDPAAVDQAAAVAAYILSQSVKADPESQVIFRIVFQAPRGWEEKYPNATYRAQDGSPTEPSVCDEEFWTVARSCLERFVRQMRLLDSKDHILGVHLERGEWFFAESAGYDNSKAAQSKFRDWARMRYLDDVVTLRASWFDGAARFDNIQIPPFQPEGQDGDRFIRSSRRQRRYVDYHLFLSDATVQRIADLAYAAKSASDGYFLVGASYGYTFEWSHPGSGHLSLGKLMRTPEIDFIAGPPSYRSRQPGGTAAFPGPIDSFALNGKLYISEEDFKTSLSIGHEPDDFNPRLNTPQALESVHWRGIGSALAHASGVAWMDLWGNGWLRTHSVWERARKVREALTDRLAAPLDDPEVAIFIDERALAYLVDDHAFKLLVQNVRESVLRAGVSAAFYLLSDLAHREKFPESKLYIFVNAWDVRPELRAAIKSRLQRDNKVLFWLYSAGLFDAGRESLERAREVTGIALKPQPFYSRAGTTILNRRHPLAEAFPDRSVVGGTKLEPSYFAIPEGATVLGEYTQTGLPSFVVKEFREGAADTHWTSVFLGEPVVNPALIRALAQMAGAHIWNHQEDVVHVRHPFCTVHCQGAGPRTIMLPGKYSAYNLLTDEWSAVDSPNLRFTAVEGSTQCFLVGPRDELENRLNADPRSALYIDQLPPREANVRVDSSNFDVPIMKLDEWMGASDSDDNADEWFLRPQQIEEERPSQAEESEERVGRRRRKRRTGNELRGSEGGRDRGRTETISASGDGLEDLELNVMFRKRESE